MISLRMSTLRDYLRVWFYWKKQAIASAILIIVGVVSFSYLYTPQYDSFAKIVVFPKTGDQTIVTSGIPDSRSTIVTVQDINTEIELLICDDVLKETVRSFMENGQGLALSATSNNPVKLVFGKLLKATKNTFIFLKLVDSLSAFDSNVQLLSESITAEPIAMSNVILLTLRAENPRASAAVLNRLTEIYIKHHNSIRTRETVDFFQNQAQEFLRKMDSTGTKMRVLQKKTGIVDVQMQNEKNIDQIGMLSQQLEQIDLACEEASQRIRLFKDALKRDGQDIVITREMQTIPSLVELEQALVPLIVKRSEMAHTYLPTSREYQNIEGQIDRISGDIRNEILKVIKTDELEMQNLVYKREFLRERINKIQKNALSFSGNNMEFKSLQKSSEFNLQNYLYYASKTEGARISAERAKRDFADVAIADYANIPVSIAFPKRLLLLILSIIFGILAALWIPFVLEFIDNKLKTEGDIESQLEVPVICSLIGPFSIKLDTRLRNKSI